MPPILGGRAMLVDVDLSGLSLAVAMNILVGWEV